MVIVLMRVGLPDGLYIHEHESPSVYGSSGTVTRTPRIPKWPLAGVHLGSVRDQRNLRTIAGGVTDASAARRASRAAAACGRSGRVMDASCISWRRSLATADLRTPPAAIILNWTQALKR